MNQSRLKREVRLSVNTPPLKGEAVIRPSCLYGRLEIAQIYALVFKPHLRGPSRLLRCHAEVSRTTTGYAPTLPVLTEIRYAQICDMVIKTVVVDMIYQLTFLRSHYQAV